MSSADRSDHRVGSTVGRRDRFKRKKNVRLDALKIQSYSRQLFFSFYLKVRDIIDVSLLPGISHQFNILDPSQINPPILNFFSTLLLQLSLPFSIFHSLNIFTSSIIFFIPTPSHIYSLFIIIISSLPPSLTV